MTYGEAANQLLECVQEYAIIVHKLKVIEAWMNVAYVLCAIAVIMFAWNRLIPDLRKLRRTRRTTHAAAPVIRQPVTTRQTRYTKSDLEDILREFNA